MNNFAKRLIAICLICVASVMCFACDFSLESENGKSAYEIAVDNGFVGSETEWLESLKGDKGDTGATGTTGEVQIVSSLYDEAKDNGFTGTFFEFLTEYVKGEKGDVGESGDGAITNAVNNSITSIVSVYCKFNKDVTINGTKSTSSYTSAGSGVIYSLDKTLGNAYIITNYHVVYSANSNTTNKICNDINVYVYGQEYEGDEITAVCIGGSLTYDIAVLKVTNSNVLKTANTKQATISSSKIYVGDVCVAVGNPEADGISATSGIVSVNSEYIEMTGADDVTDVTFRVIRVDAPVNGGNSGGGLFNKNGELIGIVNAKTVDTEIEGMAYAIPCNIAISVADNLIRNYDGTNLATVKKGSLGMTLKIENSITEYNSTLKKVDIKETIVVDSVTAGAVGETSGFIVGDQIVKIEYEGETITPTRMFEIIDVMLKVETNKTITYSVVRAGETKTIDVSFSELPTVA